ncbi:McrB family protein [Brevibacillus sp. FIR094]|uniref:McrB family protein n=1 Tax=Brevibacillus sp. FIR094 TaxID=3134809 RepID=UPI003D24F24B
MLSKINASQTKYGIVNIISLVKEGCLREYVNGSYRGDLAIDQPQLRATLGLNETNELPSYWDEIQQYPEQIGLFCLTAILFTHESFIHVFSASSTENMKGVIRRSQFENEKAFTNIRGVLVTSGASPESAIREDIVSYDFSRLIKSGEVGKIVKMLLFDRLKKTFWVENPSGNNKEHIRTFYEQCIAYEFHRVFSLTAEQFRKWLEGEGLGNKNSRPIELDLDDRVEVDTHLLVSLATKPFLILTGASGTGKTYGIRQLANSINPLKHIDENFNSTFIPVEAGWKDGRNILGYKNPFGDEGEMYQPTALINMLLKANSIQYRKIPFFVLFDEMNLSHVEMYFARFLALLETSRHEGISNVPLLPKNELLLLQKYYKNNNEFLEYVYEAIQREGLYISENLFFVGTVNIDETTYMFSPKVLDRSFVIEKATDAPSTIFNQSLIKNEVRAMLSISEVNKYLLTQYNVRKLLNNLTSIDQEILKPITDFLDQVYNLVEDFTFGYRIVVECCEYVLKAKELHTDLNVKLEWLVDDDQLYDEILMQKILPKIHGNRKQISNLIKRLTAFCKDGDVIRYKKSHIKLMAMERNLNITGYCGFIC